MTLIGSSTLNVTPLSLGGNTFGWTSTAEQSEAVLDAFVAGGGNFIDTADAYSQWAPGHSGGESETILGEWMRRRGNRANVIIATKVGKLEGLTGLAPSTIATAVELSLDRLGTDYIDLYYAHADDPETPIVETAAAFDVLVQAGKVRYVALSNYSAPRIREWMAVADEHGFARPVALQPHYNMVARREYESELLPAVLEFDLGVMPYYALASGFLTGKYRGATDLVGDGAVSPRAAGMGQYLTPEGLALLEVLDEIAAAHQCEVASVALAWLRSRPGVAAPIASASRPEQVAALLRSAELELSAEEIALLETASSSF
jgi:aryl-alcohol dehydrogenase-like predicted oxidoreductase